MEKQFEVIEPTVWKPINEGDTIEGVYISKKTEVGKYNSNAYYLEVAEETEGQEGTTIKQMLVWGNTIIDDKMEFVKAGELIRITFKKKTKNQKGQDLKIFEVAKAKTNPLTKQGDDEYLRDMIPETPPVKKTGAYHMGVDKAIPEETIPTHTIPPEDYQSEK